MSRTDGIGANTNPQSSSIFRYSGNTSASAFQRQTAEYDTLNANQLSNLSNVIKSSNSQNGDELINKIAKYNANPNDPSLSRKEAAGMDGFVEMYKKLEEQSGGPTQAQAQGQGGEMMQQLIQMALQFFTGGWGGLISGFMGGGG